MADDLSRDEARRLALAAQGLLGAPDRRGGAPALLRRLGAVQLDTIATLARSHELVPYSRLGPVGRDAVEAAYWGEPPRAFEYWSHAACILPLESWPLFAFRRREHRAGQRWGERAPVAARAEVLRRLAAEGPLTVSELGGASRGGEWWDRTPVKVAVEDLLDMGEVVCTRRVGWRRVYDLAERAIPAELLDRDPGDEECRRELVRAAAARLGVATVGDLAEHHRLRRAEVDAALPDSGLVPVTVRGWGEPAWADPRLLAELGAGRLRGRHRTTLLSPFDSLVWDRARTERVFGFVHRLEAYVPSHKRVHGYFVMPLLAGGRLAGRVDPAREGTTLVVRRVSAAARAVEALAVALREAAAWVGCDSVRVEVADPPALAEELRARL